MEPLAQVLARTCHGPLTDWVVQLNGRNVPPAAWAQTALRGGERITARGPVHGQDSDPLRTTLQVAVLIAAIYLPGAAWGLKGLEADRLTPVRRTYTYPLPADERAIDGAGTWVLRLWRLTPPSGNRRISDRVTWIAIRTYQPDTASYPGQRRLAVRIRASWQLSGRLERLSGLARRRVSCFNPETARWETGETSNPACF